MEICGIAFALAWLTLFGFILFRFATLGMRGAGLGAKVERELDSFRVESSATVKTDLSVVITRHAAAPIGLAFVQRAPLSISGAGALLTREQALALAQLLRAAAAGGQASGSVADAR